MEGNQKVSEIDNMAFTGILSVQILHDLFVKRSVPKLNEKDLVQLKKTIIET